MQTYWIINLEIFAVENILTKTKAKTELPISGQYSTIRHNGDFYAIHIQVNICGNIKLHHCIAFAIFIVILHFISVQVGN